MATVTYALLHWRLGWADPATMTKAQGCLFREKPLWDQLRLIQSHEQGLEKPWSSSFPSLPCPFHPDSQYFIPLFDFLSLTVNILTQHLKTLWSGSASQRCVFFFLLTLYSFDEITLVDNHSQLWHCLSVLFVFLLTGKNSTLMFMLINCLLEVDAGFQSMALHGQVWNFRDLKKSS